MTVKPHPLNTCFTWINRPLTGLRALSPEQVEVYNTKGYCILPSVLREETITGLLAEIDPIERQIEGYTITLDDETTIAYGADDMTFAIDLSAQCDAVRRLATGAVFQDIVGDIVGDRVRLYWTQAVYKKPGKGRVFPWHQDNGYTFTEPQTYLTCWIPLTAATRENGCPHVIPGLHQGGTLTHAISPAGLEIEGLSGGGEEARAECLEVEPGDIILLSSLTPHKTGANTTDAVRKALILQFAPDGLVRVGPDGGLVPQTDPLRNMIILDRAGPHVPSRL